MLQSTVTLGRSICVILVLHTFITTTTITTFAIIITTTSSRQLDFNNKVSNQSVKVEISNSQQHRQHSQWETEAFQYSTNEIVASDFDLFWFDCNYNSIEPNYFQVNNTFLLAFGGVLLYQCTSIVDVRNCTSIGNIDHYNAHLAGTKLISSLNCQDVSITIHQPDSLNLFPEAKSYVKEDARRVPYISDYDKYVAWLNITNVSAAHQGEYWMEFYIGEHQLYRHSITLSVINNTELEKNDQNSNLQPVNETFIIQASQWNLLPLGITLWLIILMLLSLFIICCVMASKYSYEVMQCA